MLEQDGSDAERDLLLGSLSTFTEIIALSLRFLAAALSEARKEGQLQRCAASFSSNGSMSEADGRVYLENAFAAVSALFPQMQDFSCSLALVALMRELTAGSQKTIDVGAYVYATLKGPFPSTDRALFGLLEQICGGTNAKFMLAWLLDGIQECATRLEVISVGGEGFLSGIRV